MLKYILMINAIFCNFVQIYQALCRSQAAMFSAMLSGLSGDGTMSSINNSRSLLDCAAQAGHTQARNFGLASLATSNSGIIMEYMTSFC